MLSQFAGSSSDSGLSWAGFAPGAANRTDWESKDCTTTQVEHDQTVLRVVAYSLGALVDSCTLFTALLGGSDLGSSRTLLSHR